MSVAHATRLEAGQATTFDTAVNPNFAPITFQETFDTIPIVTVLTTNQGTDSAMLRIRNVTRFGFEVAVVESPGETGPHDAMTFDYIAMEPGQITLPTGETVIAGFHTTSTIQASTVLGLTRGWDTINIGTTIAPSVSVLADIQTQNSESGAVPGAPSMPLLAVVMRNLSSTTFQIALERSEVDDGTVVDETIGWIAFPNGGTGSFSTVAGANIDWDARITPNVFRGFADPCTASPFSSTPWPNRIVVASKVSRNGGDGGWLRRCSLNATQIGIQVDEDVDNDPDRAHIAETASLLAFSNAFHAIFDGKISAQKTVTVIEGPDGSTTDPYALPGARVRYTVAMQSLGNGAIDADSLSFIDPIPPDTALVVSNFPGVTGPVRFTDGNPVSGLSYTFTSFSDTADDIDFSDNGGISFAYAPTPSGDGSDPAVTHIRVRPQGAFNGATGAGLPAFTLDFDVILQ